MKVTLKEDTDGSLVLRDGSGKELAQVYTSSRSLGDDSPDWIDIYTAEHDALAKIPVEALPQLRRALSLIAKRLKEKKNVAP